MTSRTRRAALALVGGLVALGSVIVPSVASPAPAPAVLAGALHRHDGDHRRRGPLRVRRRRRGAMCAPTRAIGLRRPHARRASRSQAPRSSRACSAGSTVSRPPTPATGRPLPTRTGPTGTPRGADRGPTARRAPAAACRRRAASRAGPSVTVTSRGWRRPRRRRPRRPLVRRRPPPRRDRLGGPATATPTTADAQAGGAGATSTTAPATARRAPRANLARRSPEAEDDGADGENALRGESASATEPVR